MTAPERSTTKAMPFVLTLSDLKKSVSCVSAMSVAATPTSVRSAR